MLPSTIREKNKIIFLEEPLQVYNNRNDNRVWTQKSCGQLFTQVDLVQFPALIICCPKRFLTYRMLANDQNQLQQGFTLLVRLAEITIRPCNQTLLQYVPGTVNLVWEWSCGKCMQVEQETHWPPQTSRRKAEVLYDYIFSIYYSVSNYLYILLYTLIFHSCVCPWAHIAAYICYLSFKSHVH